MDYESILRQLDICNPQRKICGKGWNLIVESQSADAEKCVLWTLGKDKDGYGKIKVAGTHLRAHRLSLALKTKYYDKDMIAIHGECNNPSCINPNHLRWGTLVDNAQDKFRDGTAQLGEQRVNSKWTIEQVMMVKQLIKQKMSKYEISAITGVTVASVDNIRLGRSWRHFPLQEGCKV